MPEERTLDHGEPGRSARRQYERRAHREQDRVRRRYGRLGGIAVRLADEPQHVTAWRTGADGEVEAARKLERHLAGTGVVLLHDRRIPGSRANIDHIAVGPGGVTVIDPKAYKGRLRVERRGGLFRPRTQHLVVAGRDRTKLVDGMERQIEVVRAIAGDGVDVRGALCWMKGEGIPLLGTIEIRGIRIDRPKGVARLAARGGALAPDAVAALAHELAEQLPPA